MATNSRAVGDSTLTIAAELRAQRTARRLKQEEVSAGSGVPVTTLSKLERGQTAIDSEQIEALARFYGMTGPELWDLAQRKADMAKAGDPVSKAAAQGEAALKSGKIRLVPPDDDDIAEFRAKRREDDPTE